MNAPFTDNSLNELVERIRAFNHEDAAPSEQKDLLVALKLLADETTKRWDQITKIELDLKNRITAIELRTAMKKVLDVTDEGNKARERYNRAIDTRINNDLHASGIRTWDETPPVQPEQAGFFARFLGGRG